MKSLQFIIVVVFATILSNTAFAQTHDHSKMAAETTETIKVSGNCEMCKARIEKAAKIDGVSKAEWNVKTKMLTLTYVPDKVKSEDVQKRIALVGHDTPKFRAADKTYNSLPGCCKYR